MDGDVSGALEHAARGRRTQSFFRAVNERVYEINEAYNVFLPYGDWVCECAEETCVERIAMTPVEFVAVRCDATHFLVAPSNEHVLDQIEHVVERTDRYWVVEEYGVAGELLVTKTTLGRVVLRD